MKGMSDPVAFEKAKATKAAKRAAKEEAGLTLNWGRTDAIRAKCLDCSSFSASEVRHCLITDCPLYPFRLGSEVPPEEKKAWELRYMASRDGKIFLSRREGVETEEAKET
jgi:hypothetical protein